MAHHDKLKTVPEVDLKRYLGTWFEICRLPNRFEDPQASDVTATYRKNDDGTVAVDNRCYDGRGDPEQARGRAVPIDETNARLHVSFLPRYLRWLPFTKGDYWIIRLADDYSVALVGSPDRKYLWLLSRAPELDHDIQRVYLDTAREQGFDISQLIFPQQSGEIVEIPDG